MRPAATDTCAVTQAAGASSSPSTWIHPLQLPSRPKPHADLFGWQTQSADGDMSYGLVTPSDGGIGGGVGQSQDGGNGHVTFFVEVDDPAAYLARVEKLGGTTVVPPTEIPSYNLTFAYLTDPQGHLIGLSKGVAHWASTWCAGRAAPAHHVVRSAHTTWADDRSVVHDRGLQRRAQFRDAHRLARSVTAAARLARSAKKLVIGATGRARQGRSVRRVPAEC
jgi:uncharacterized protein